MEPSLFFKIFAFSAISLCILSTVKGAASCPPYNYRPLIMGNGGKMEMVNQHTEKLGGDTTAWVVNLEARGAHVTRSSYTNYPSKGMTALQLDFKAGFMANSFAVHFYNDPSGQPRPVAQYSLEPGAECTMIWNDQEVREIRVW